MSTRQSSTGGAGTTSDHPAAGSKKFGSQGGGRPKGGPRGSSKAPSNQGTPSDEAVHTSNPRKKAPSNHKDRDPKSRPSTQQRSHKAGGGGGGASRGKAAENGHNHHTNRHRDGSGQHSDGRGQHRDSGGQHRDGGGRDGGGQHREGSHRTGSGTSLDGFPGSNSTGGRTETRILSSNRFEKLEIDPDSGATSASGESLSKSSSSSSTSPASSLNLPSSTNKAGEDRRPAKERSSRSGSGRGSFRGRGSAKFQPDSVEEGGRSSGHNSGAQKDDKGVQRGEGGGQRKKSPKQIRFDLPSEEDLEQSGTGHANGTHLEQAAVSMVGLSSSVTGDKGDSEGVDSVGDETTPSEAGGVAEINAAQKTVRIVYDRDFLLSLKTHFHSFHPPPGLDMFDLLPHTQSSSFPTDHPFRKDSTSSTEDSKPLKHPTALALIKEHDKHFVGKVSLSPQRGSFQRGCSWKDRVSNSDVPQNSSEASLKTHPKFSSGNGQSDPPSYLKFEGQKPQSGGRPSGPRVIHHIPLRDQEQRLNGKKGWRGDVKEDYVEPEPEWMEFGPTDRFDVIELKGFEEHEVGREDGAPAKDSPTEEVADQADGPAEDKESPKEPKPQAAASPPPPPQQQEEDNEFILDGFDFSTGLSICKALDLDEDEAGTVKKSSLLLPNKAVTDPSELGNVLLRALGVNKEASCSSESKAAPPHSTNTGINSHVVSGAPPANALTLDEIYAREDIHPSPAQAPKDTASVGEGMEAFNKLLAVLESKQAKPSQENYSPGSLSYADPVHAVLQQVPRPEHPVKQVSSRYGYPLDKELLNIEEDLSATNHLAFPQPNLRRLEQLERMLESMDRMDPTTAQHYEYHNMTAPHVPLPPPPRRLHQMDQRVPVHPVQMDREGRGWMYQQEQRGRSHPTPQQLAAARQHQMLTNARGTANNWAVEMEQRRQMELRQMQLAKEKEMYGSGMPPQGYKASKPNISLLPTAVMRHMNTNKPGQTGADLPKTTLISNRLDQDLTKKASQTHSVLNSLLNQSQEFSGHHPSDYAAMHGPQHPHRVLPAGGMRMASHNPPKPSDMPPSGSVYPHYNLPHGMPVQNPYMY